MVFNPSNYVVESVKPLPVLLLLDVSTSMQHTKINQLNQAVKEMIDSFSSNETSEIEIQVSIITFGSTVELYMPFTSASDIDWKPLSVSGATPMGTAFRMAKDMIEDTNATPKRAYRPTVILVSDGMPTDQWKGTLDNFINSGRSSKCDRMAVAIQQPDTRVLDYFVDGCEFPVFKAEDAGQIRDKFKFITMSVTARSQSQNPNLVPKATDIVEETELDEAPILKPLNEVEEVIETEQEQQVSLCVKATTEHKPSSKKTDVHGASSTVNITTAAKVNADDDEDDFF